MARPQANAKMGITPDGRRRVGDTAYYSVGDLLSRAVAMREYERWSEFVTYLKTKTRCPVVNVVALTSFIAREAPFLGVFGKIDPVAVKEVLEECGGIHHIAKKRHNTYTDPRQATADMRFARNHRYVRKLVRTGEINGGSDTDMMRVLTREVPLSTDRQFLRKILRESGFTDRGRFDKGLFEEKIVALGWSSFTREQTDFLYILTLELEESPEDTLLQEQAGEARASAPAVPTEVIPEQSEMPVKSDPAPVIEPEMPKEAPVEDVAESEPAMRVEVEEVPSTPEPAAVETIEKVVATAGRKKVRTNAERAAAHRGMFLLARILREEYDWPFGNILPHNMLNVVVWEVYRGSLKPAAFLQIMKQEGLIRPAGYYKTGYLWEALDVEIVESRGSAKEVMEDWLRTLWKPSESDRRLIHEAWRRILKQNSRQFSKVLPPPDLEEEIVEEMEEEIGWAMRILETVPSPESLMSAVESEPPPEPEMPVEVRVEVVVEPVAETERELIPPPDMKTQLLALDASERRALLLEHCADAIEELVNARLIHKLNEAGNRLTVLRKERMDAVTEAEAILAESKAKLAETEAQLAGIVVLLDALPPN